MRTRTWKKIYDAPGGLRFFVQLIDGELEAMRRVAIADRSGATPDKTDDGVLWIDLDRPWYVEATRFSIPVLRDGDKRGLWTGESTEHLFQLLKVLRQPECEEIALSIVCKPHKEGGVGARAIIKCLAMGVQP